MPKRPDWEIRAAAQPRGDDYDFDLDKVLSSVVSLEAEVAEDAFTAQTLGTERIGNAVLIREDGLVLTIGYLITEAESVRLTTAAGRVVEAHVLGVDPASGFGFLQALSDLGVAPVPIGDSRHAKSGDAVLVAAAGGPARTVVGDIVARDEFAGYWEYLLEAAIFTAPAHPFWSGAALIGESGELLGVGSLQVQQQARGGKATVLNMAVPCELLPADLDPFIAGLRSAPGRPWLGVFAQEAADQVVIVGVSPGGPGERAGLRAGDVVRAVGGVEISSLPDFYLSLWGLGPAGVEAPLRLEREKDVFEVLVKSGDRRRFLKGPRLH